MQQLPDNRLELAQQVFDEFVAVLSKPTVIRFPDSVAINGVPLVELCLDNGIVPDMPAFIRKVARLANLPELLDLPYEQCSFRLDSPPRNVLSDNEFSSAMETTGAQGK